MMQRKLWACLLFLLMTGSLFAGDNDNQDVGLWIVAGLSPRLSPHWDANFSFEYRMKDDLKEVDLYSLAGQFHYVINRLIKVGMGYEFFWNNILGKGYETEQRLYAESIVQHSFGSINLSWRPRIQDTYFHLSDPNWDIRNRFKISYSIIKFSLKPHASIEPYYRLGEHASFSKTRYIAGCTYTFAKKNELDLYYLAEKYQQISFTRNVIGITYNYSF